MLLMLTKNAYITCYRIEFHTRILFQTIRALTMSRNSIKPERYHIKFHSCQQTESCYIDNLFNPQKMVSNKF